jgi:RimJ/RimL family protein N-acetyltransferase
VMQVLEKRKYQTALPLAAGLADQGMALSVLAGVRPGRVVVDAADSPTSLCLVAPEGTFAWVYLAGGARNPEFAKALRSWVFEEKGLGPDVGFLFAAVDCPEWEDALATIIAPRTVIPDRRMYFEYSSRTRARRRAVPAGYSIMDVDRALLESNVEMHPMVTRWLTANFGSADGFLEHGVGAVAVHAGKVVGWILADSLVGDLCDIGGEVQEEHRRKGLAHAATRRTVELALDRGARRIGWHCHAINIPSVKTAKAAGFTLVHEDKVYPIHFDTEKHEGLVEIVAGEYAEAGKAAMASGDYASADALYIVALRLTQTPSADVLHAAAGAAARRGESSRAFELLAKAVEARRPTMSPEDSRPLHQRITPASAE